MKYLWDKVSGEEKKNENGCRRLREKEKITGKYQESEKSLKEEMRRGGVIKLRIKKCTSFY